ncbi:hypothetical protein [Neobacillus rhizophilus]|uniref:Uncharacterized protein n=1 Tax=Neobacillus rhizophilus TaxID=2833579 RepID=A0A942U8U5_9BACI|nr:hypothetical protein [Neobacillus rhizophilus]MBS4215047.1 hypothetical protein [Neobacillus rhizophilus]
MSIELLSKNTADVFNAIVREPNWDKTELLEGIKKIILQARDSVGSPEEYLESLLVNVTLQSAYTNTAISFLTECIEEEQFLSHESFQSIMANVPNQVKDSNFIGENMPRFKELVYKGSTSEEHIAYAESVYFHTKLVNDLLIGFIGIFLEPDNRNYMDNYLEYSSKVVVDAVMHYCQTYSNHILEEINAMNSTQ